MYARMGWEPSPRSCQDRGRVLYEPERQIVTMQFDVWTSTDFEESVEFVLTEEETELFAAMLDRFFMIENGMSFGRYADSLGKIMALPGETVNIEPNGDIAFSINAVTGDNIIDVSVGDTSKELQTMLLGSTDRTMLVNPNALISGIRGVGKAHALGKLMDSFTKMQEEARIANASNNWRRMHGYPLRRKASNKSFKQRKKRKKVFILDEAQFLIKKADPALLAVGRSKNIQVTEIHQDPFILPFPTER